MSIPDFLAALLLPPAASAGWQVVFRLLRWAQMTGVRQFAVGWVSGAAGGIIMGGIERHWAWMGGSSVSLAIVLALWWHRRNRGRARGLIGAKSRALRDALAARMPRPRPALVPGGAS